LFNYPKTWTDDEVLTNEDLNAQFNTVKDNMIAEKVEGASTVNNVYNAAKAIAQTDPDPVGPTNFASSVEEEIKRLRFMISSITGNANYTLAPVKNIDELNQALLSQTERAAQFLMLSSVPSIQRAMRSGIYYFDGNLSRPIDSSFFNTQGKFNNSINVLPGTGIGINTDTNAKSNLPTILITVKD